ncbi:MAG: FUSC family protein [Rhodoluna sp.]|nr:FUSC family protein [Rhodoluna sp.]
MNIKWSLKDAVARLLDSIVPILQIVFAAAAGYSFSRWVLGHEVPLLSVTVTITALGFTRDARPRRVLETALGMITGIALSESMLLGFGPGIWQMAVTLLLCLMLARFISGSASFALTVGIQAILVQLLQAPIGGVYTRSIDGIVGGSIALLVTALIPRDPRGIARKDAGKLFEVFIDSLEALKTATRDVNVAVADETLKQVRRTQPLIDNWRLSLDSAISISRVSPFLIKYRDELRGQVRLMRGMDLATRNLRVVARRIDFLLRDGQKRPHLADLFEQLLVGAKLLQKGLAEPEALGDAQEVFLEVIHQLDPKKFGIADQIREASVLLLLRPMLVDLLCASGMSEEDAREELPEI